MRVEGNIGLNSISKNLIAIHPSELHMIYAIGSQIVIKSVDD